jgi:electron transfer flavoprotein beta subunit
MVGFCSKQFDSKFYNIFIFIHCSVGRVNKKERAFAFLLTPPCPACIVGHMRILVCVKQVPDTESPIQINDIADWIRTDEISEFRMNRLDEFAVEEAVLIKEASLDTAIDAITMGPGRCAEVVKRSIGMGADKGIHIIDKSDYYRTSFEISSAIAEYARDKCYDLIFTGAVSEDNMQGQVGPMIAAHLALPCATAVIFEKIAFDKKAVYVEREIEGGARDILELQLPAVLTIQSGINRPRYPSLSNLLRANQQDMETIKIADLAPPPPKERLVQVVYPKRSRDGVVLSGTRKDKAAQLVTILRDKALL